MRTVTRLPAVETRSLILREIELRDAQSFANFMLQEDYQRFIAARLANLAEVRAFVSRAVARQGDERRSAFHLAAEEKHSGEAIGDGFLIRQQPRNVEIGWGLHPAMWRMGLGREIGAALLGLAFERLGADTVWSKVMGGNAASARLAQTIGMRRTRAVTDYAIAPGVTGRVDVFTMTAARYFERSY